VDCTSPWTTPSLSDGTHSVSVRSTDVAGNTDGSPATRTFVVDTGPAGGRLLLGSATVQPVADAIPAGSAEAFAATASGSGTLRTKGMLAAPVALAWNDITVPDASLVRGETYWLALLGVGVGSLRFRDGLGIGCHSEVSRSATLTTLPGDMADGIRLGLVQCLGPRQRVMSITLTWHTQAGATTVAP
jgi:hypothetical protein